MNVESQIKITALHVVNVPNPQVDVTILRSKLFVEPERLTKVFDGLLKLTTETSTLLQVDGVATYRISNGNKIEIDPEENTSINEICLYLLGTVFAELLKQRGIRCMHGACLSHNEFTFLITGHSGVGKSTTCRYLIENGFKYLSDDVVPTIISEEVQVYSSFPSIKLWEDVIISFGESPSSFSHLIPGKPKYRIKNIEHFTSGKKKLNAIIVLDWGGSGEFKLAKATEVQGLLYVREHIYRKELFTGTDEINAEWSFCRDIVNKVSIFQIQGARSFATLELLPKHILTLKDERNLYFREKI